MEENGMRFCDTCGAFLGAGDAFNSFDECWICEAAMMMIHSPSARNDQLEAIMRKHKISIPDPISSGDDELRAQRLASAINDAMSSRDTIAINTHGQTIPSPGFDAPSKLLLEFVEQIRPFAGLWRLNGIGIYLLQNMPSMV